MITTNCQLNRERTSIRTNNRQSGKQWYVMRTIGRRESKVKEYIDTMLKTNATFAQYVSQVLIPMEKVRTERKGKICFINKPKISGYVYVEAELVGNIQSMLSRVPNVLGFLNYSKSDNKPMPLSRKEAEVLLASTGKTEGMSTDFRTSFDKGESVIITEGPFKGFNAVVEDANSEKGKLTVSVKIFGQKTPLELQFTQVGRI